MRWKSYSTLLLGGIGAVTCAWIVGADADQADVSHSAAITAAGRAVDLGTTAIMAADPAPATTSSRGDQRRNRGDGQGGDRADRGARPSRFSMGPGLPVIENTEPSDEEWGKIVEFWKTHSPHRNAEFERFVTEVGALPEGDDRTQRERFVRETRRRMAIRYRMWAALEREQPGMSGYTIEQLEIEDRVFVAFRNLQANRDDPQLKAAYRDLVSQFIDSNFRERTARLNELEKLVKRERERLEREAQDRDRRIDEQVKRFDRTFGGLLGRPGRGDGRQ